MKATALAPSNIAFIKYWGKQNDIMRTPLNASLSMNLDSAYTITTVDFSQAYTEDTITLIGGVFSEDEKKRILTFLDKIRTQVDIHHYARIATKNTFPKGTGIAASASGFAALTVSAFTAAGFSLPEKDLTIFARFGSGSACRSIPNGFVLWKKGSSSRSSYAYSLYPPTYWDLRDILVIVNREEKSISTSEGQKGVTTSPLWKKRIVGVPGKIKKMIRAFKEKNFQQLGILIEEDCLSMHEVMQTQNPPVMYWNETTYKLMKAVRRFRTEGLPVYFTIDAGPNVHLICEAASEKEVRERIRDINDVKEIIVNRPAVGTHLIQNHLF